MCSFSGHFIRAFCVNRLEVHDTVGVMSMHGWPGLVGWAAGPSLPQPPSEPLLPQPTAILPITHRHPIHFTPGMAQMIFPSLYLRASEFDDPPASQKIYSTPKIRSMPETIRFALHLKGDMSAGNLQTGRHLVSAAVEQRLPLRRSAGLGGLGGGRGEAEGCIFVFNEHVYAYHLAPSPFMLLILALIRPRSQRI